MEEDYFAILDCVKGDRDVHLCPALHLRRLSEDQYGRLRPKTKHFKRPVSSSYQGEEGYRSVYIRQQPVYYHLPQFRLSPLNVESGLGFSDGARYRLFDKYPARYWNSATMTLSVRYSPKLQAMGVFRFQSIDKSSEKVDVVVGLRRLNTMEWEGWCFQLAYRDESLEHVFQEINKKIEKTTRKSNNSEMTSSTLRDSLGEDSTLASSATVEGVQLQGRLYISISVIPRAELLAESATFQISTNAIELSRCNQTVKSTSSNSGARAMTEVYCWSSSSQFGLDPSSPLMWMVQPVRVTSLSGDGAFMKPLYDFMSQLQQKKIKGGSNNTLSAIEQLAEALFLRDLDRAMTLIKFKVPDINSRTTDEYGFAPLHWAVAGGSSDCITLLRKNGAECKIFTESGLSPAHIAALCNNSVWSALAHLNDEGEAAWLANERTWPFSETPLHLAAASTPDTELGEQFFQELLDWSWVPTGPNPRNIFEETPLHRAAAGNNASAIEALVAFSPWGFNIDNVDQYGRTSLWHAAAAGACKAIKSLIRLGASVNLTDDLGRSPLHAACRGGHDDAVKLLRQHGARSDIETNSLNLLPMHLAAMFGYVDCLTLFLDPSWRIVSQASLDKAVQIAASFGKQACVESLCQYGANPYVAFEYYLRPSDGHAVVVEKEADAYTAARSEQQWHIVSYFNTSKALRDLQKRVYPIEGQLGTDNSMPSFSAPIDALPPKGESEPAYILSEPYYGNPAHENAPAPDTMPHASNNPHYPIAPNTDTPLHGNLPVSVSPYAPRQRPPQAYESLGQQSSANLPARANPWSSAPLSQSKRLQELVNPQGGYRYQSAPSQERPIISVYASAPAAENWPLGQGNSYGRSASGPTSWFHAMWRHKVLEKRRGR
ncbi:putative ankyrin repeat-containing protein [Trichoderma atroviride IMI 206040]|uniref:Ankyrin repeat-containing protein n=1 Tax=Hypocrea atroviridis (strain ATCC 20476 / IMI 206040) TaxID=452589 RepID=G9P4X6_HYPAI|nr:putative ankyrin repeat-containing protein [Trichoderma atroviride IMI 206040]EHK42058.1 putative ankyrin repeat-containing protein [Trichoderma atroviride IMI 206040]